MDPVVAIVERSNVSVAGFAAFELFLPLELNGDRWLRTPRIRSVLRSRGGRWDQVSEHHAEEVAPKSTKRFLEKCLQNGTHLMADVRKAWLEHQYGS